MTGRLLAKCSAMHLPCMPSRVNLPDCECTAVTEQALNCATCCRLLCRLPDSGTSGACRLPPSMLEDKRACAAPLLVTPECSSADALRCCGTHFDLPSLDSLESLQPSAADAAPRPSSSSASCCASSQPATPRVPDDSLVGSPEAPAPCQSAACGAQRARPCAGKEWLLPWAEAGFGGCGGTRSGSNDDDDADSAAASKRRRTGGVQVWPEPSMRLRMAGGCTEPDEAM